VRERSSKLAWPVSTVLVAVAVAAAWPLALSADAIQFKDGRMFDVPKVVRADGGWKIALEHGEIFVKAELVERVLASDAGGNYVPKDDEEKAKLEKGLVPYEGKWIPKADRDKAVEKKLEKAKKEMEEAKKHLEWRDRYKTETKHFKFEYTIPPAKCQEYQELMEVYYETFMKKWGIRPAAKTPKLLVCFYHDEEYYYQVSGAPRGAIGYFRFVDPIELNFYYDRNDERLTLDVMFHETNHYLTYLINPKFNYPPWVNESLAEYYGASEWDRVKKAMSVGHIQEGRLVVLQDAIAGDEWQGLEEMIRLPEFDALHYAWGWSFVHFLMESKKYSQGFQRFYLALSTDKDVKRVAFQGAMVQCESDEVIKTLKKFLQIKDLKPLETEWHAYVKDTLKLETHRGYEEAAEWADRWGLTIKAGRYYKTAVEKGTKNPLTFDHYGDWFARKSQQDDAIGMYEKAIELDPMNPYFYMHLGQAWEAKGGDDGKKKGEDYKKLAIELDPHDPWLALQSRGVVIQGK